MSKDYGPTLQLAKDEAMRLLGRYSYMDSNANATTHLAGAILLAAVVLAENRQREETEG